MRTTKTIHSYIHVAMLSGAIICAGFAIGRAAGDGNDPRVIGYEGFLSQGAGPVTGTVPATFRLFDSQQEGTGVQLWESNSVQLSVVDGWFSVALGDNTPRELDGVPFQQNSLPEGVWAASRLFLGIEVNGQPLGGRQEILVSPYAVRAVPGMAFRANGIDVLPQNQDIEGGEVHLLPAPNTSQTHWYLDSYDGRARIHDGTWDRFAVYSDGLTHSPGGHLANGIGIGTQYYAPSQFAYETIELNSGHNLRVRFGSVEQFRIDNTGDVSVGRSVSVTSDIAAPNNQHGSCYWSNLRQDDGSSYWFECPNGQFMAGVQEYDKEVTYIKCCQI